MHTRSWWRISIITPLGLTAKIVNDSMDRCAVLAEVGYFRFEGNQADYYD